jgi:arylsulfatase A-like enzyme
VVSDPARRHHPGRAGPHPEQGYHLTPDQPFFCYFAPGATHAPHHVPKEWADRYRGKFDQGWDALREETFARQKELGVIAADAELTSRHEQIPAWDDMPDELMPVLARQMEVYAGFLEYADHHTGRVIDALQDLGILDDTLVIYIIGDNDASAERTLQGTFNEMITPSGMGQLETPSGTRPSTSRCSAIVASTTRAGRPSPSTAPPGRPPTRSASPSTTTSGSSTTAPATGLRPATGPPAGPH